MRDDFVLGETVIAAMRLAATETPTGQPLTTGRVLSALTRVDMTNDWQRIWLYTGEPQLLGLVAEPDPVDASPREAQRWDGVRLSDALADAFALLWRICRAYRLLPAPSGAMALALLADPASGATRALLRPGGLSQAKLLELVQSDLLHTTLNGVGDLIAADAGAPSVAAVPSSPRARGGPLVALPARRGSRWSLVAWRAVACLALALTAMAIFWNRQVLPSAASPVLPPYSVPTIAHQMLTTADLPAVGEGGWLQMQDGPPNTGLFAGTGRFRGDVRETYFAGAWQRTWVAVDAGAVFQEAAYVARTRAAAVAFMPTECAPARQTPLPGATVAGYQEQKPGFAEACALALRGRTLLVFSVVAQGNAARTVPWQLLAVAVQRQVPRVPATATDLPLEDFLATDTMTELNSLLMLVVVAIPLLLGLVTVLRDRSAWRRLRSRMSLSWLVRNTAVATFRVDRVVSVREARLAGLALVRVAVVVWSIRLSEHGHLSLPQTGGVVAATVAGILGVEWLIRRLTTPGAWRPAIFSGRRLVIGVVSLLLSAGIAGAGVLLVVAGIVLASVDTGTDGVSDYVSGRIGIGLPVFGGVLIVVALVPFMLARRLGMRALQDEAKKERSADEERHPVLMLRSFTDDRRLLRALRGTRRAWACAHAQRPQPEAAAAARGGAPQFPERQVDEARQRSDLRGPSDQRHGRPLGFPAVGDRRDPRRQSAGPNDLLAAAHQQARAAQAVDSTRGRPRYRWRSAERHPSGLGRPGCRLPRRKRS